MDKAELLDEVKTCERFYRVTMDGRWEDFPTLEQAQEYITKQWGEKSTYCSIRLLSYSLNVKRL